MTYSFEIGFFRGDSAFLCYSLDSDCCVTVDRKRGSYVGGIIVEGDSYRIRYESGRLTKAFPCYMTPELSYRDETENPGWGLSDGFRLLSYSHSKRFKSNPSARRVRFVDEKGILALDKSLTYKAKKLHK